MTRNSKIFPYRPQFFSHKNGTILIYQRWKQHIFKLLALVHFTHILIFITCHWTITSSAGCVDFPSCSCNDGIVKCSSPAWPDHLPRRGIALQLVTLSLPTHLKDAHKQSAQQATIQTVHLKYATMSCYFAALLKLIKKNSCFPNWNWKLELILWHNYQLLL